MHYITNRVNRPAHSGRLERFVGREHLERMSEQFSHWYGPPVHLLDLPGSVRVAAGGDFVGPFDFGSESSWADLMVTRLRRFWRDLGRVTPAFGAGFASVGDALARASSGDKQYLNGGMISKTGSTGVSSAAFSLWRSSGQPSAGAAGSAAPGGRALTSATTGAMAFNNPSSGTLHLTGANFAANAANNAVMLYDRIFDVAKTMNSTATESVTGVPTRYQSSTPTAADYAGGNFLFIEVGGTALAATAHNWTTCLYRNQAGTDNVTLPSVTGNSGAIVDRFDMPFNTWFCPLASGDTGIMDLAQMQCSAAVATGAINFVIGHPIGVMMFPVSGVPLPFNWLTGPDLAPRIFNDAALAMFEFPKPSTSAITYSGMITATRALP